MTCHAILVPIAIFALACEQAPSSRLVPLTLDYTRLARSKTNRERVRRLYLLLPARPWYEKRRENIWRETGPKRNLHSACLQFVTTCFISLPQSTKLPHQSSKGPFVPTLRKNSNGSERNPPCLSVSGKSFTENGKKKNTSTKTRTARD